MANRNNLRKYFKVKPVFWQEAISTVGTKVSRLYVAQDKESSAYIKCPHSEDE